MLLVSLLTIAQPCVLKLRKRLKNIFDLICIGRNFNNLYARTVICFFFGKMASKQSKLNLITSLIHNEETFVPFLLLFKSLGSMYDYTI